MQTPKSPVGTYLGQVYLVALVLDNGDGSVCYKAEVSYAFYKTAHLGRKCLSFFSPFKMKTALSFMENVHLIVVVQHSYAVELLWTLN